MRDKLPDAVAKLHLWISEQRHVLVHCQSGISRSATVVIAYLIKHKGMSLIEAYEHCLSIRPMINPNDGFFRALQDFRDAVTQTRPQRDEETLSYGVFQLVSQL